MAITVLILFALQLEVRSQVRAALLERQKDFIVDKSLVLGEIGSREAALRHAVVSAELAWQEKVEIDRADVARFRASGGEMTFQPSRALTPQFVFVTGHSHATDSEIRRYLGIAAQLAHTTKESSLLRGETLTGYYYSARRDFAALTPAPERADARTRSVLSDRDALIRALEAGIEPERLSTSSHPDAPVLRWLAPSTSPLSGQPVVRLAAAALDGNDPFAVFVTEYTPQSLLLPVALNAMNGSFLILSDDRSVLAVREGGDVDGAVVERILRVAEYPKSDVSVRPGLLKGSPGIFVIGDKLGDTGWTLVFAFSWYDVLSGLATQLLTATVAALATIAALWVTLLLFNRRVFRPVYEQSQRVFDSEQLSRTLIEMAPVGLGLITHDDARPLLSSPLMESMASQAQFEGTTLAAELVRLHDRQAQQGVVQFDLSVNTAQDPAVDLSVSMAQARYQGRAVLVTAFTDVTARKHLERRLREARQAADEANAAKSAFLATMSHEIRTPLNAVMGNLELLGHSGLSAKQHDRLSTIRQSSEGLLAVISDVLDFSKIEAGEMALERLVFEVVPVLERALGLFAPMARAKGLRLHAVLACEPGQTVMGDPTRLGQIVNNLLGNAIKFTAAGKVTLRASMADGDLVVSVEDTGIGLTEEQQAGLFQAFAQADRTISRRFGGTGLGLALCQRLAQAMGGRIGVESEHGAGSRFTLHLAAGQPQRFAERTFAHESRPVIFVSGECEWHEAVVPHLRAWGLGVRAYRQAREVEPQVVESACGIVLCGEGATGDAAQAENRLVESGLWVVTASAEGPWEPRRFGRVIDVTGYSIVALARAMRMAVLGEVGTPGVPQASSVTQGFSCSLSVLVAEDNVVNRELFVEQLALLGCDARVVGSGEAALKALGDRHWDVVLTDLHMPGMSGYELAARIHARHGEMPVVAVTAQATLEERQRCETAGLARMVTKPLSLGALRAVLEDVAGGGLAAPHASDEAAGVLGGRPLPAHLVEAFREASGASLAAIEKVLRCGEMERLLAELHALRGMLGVFRAQELARRCERFELSIEKQRADQIDLAEFAAFAADVRALT
ncbi:hybrid sensor histidine kinase/response regulator [Paraburkholderia ferrariae]|uniref:hybrid sensor histidine kinase/response regulator n=1 Tax=Paraburkholderia ferrariae TaxID=386056 RepID=UPI00146FCE00|nr:hybrid sensor histidine kinase/response regulator [Paraburkholderia ferrariae]